MNHRNAVVVQHSGFEGFRAIDEKQRLRRLVTQLLTHHDRLLSEYAKQLFDSVAQQLAGIHLELAAADNALRNAGALDSLSGPRGNVRTLLDEVRTLSETLHPGAIEGGGLPAALRKLARKRARASSRQIEVFVDDIGPTLAPVSAIVLYNAADAALTVAVEYRSAFPVLVTLKFENGDALLEISGDVPGVDVAFGMFGSGTSRSSFNPEMLRLLGGRFHFRTEVDGGTTSVITVPCAPDF